MSNQSLSALLRMAAKARDAASKAMDNERLADIAVRREARRQAYAALHRRGIAPGCIVMLTGSQISHWWRDKPWIFNGIDIYHDRYNSADAVWSCRVLLTGFRANGKPRTVDDVVFLDLTKPADIAREMRAHKP